MGLQGAFFLVMGGYTIQRSVSKEKPEVAITLTGKGFERLVDSVGRWPKEQIWEAPPRLSIYARMWAGTRLLLAGRGYGSCEPQPEYLEDRLQAEKQKEENLGDLVATFLTNPFEKELIEDKGKADSVSKAIVSCQALWMLMQCAARWHKHLPVTLTEIHVAIQILYAGAMYACWWYKPMDVEQPIAIPTDNKLWQTLLDAVPRESAAYEESREPDATRTETDNEGAIGSDTTLQETDEVDPILRIPSMEPTTHGGDRTSGEVTTGLLTSRRTSVVASMEAQGRNCGTPMAHGKNLASLTLPTGRLVSSAEYQPTIDYSPDMPFVVESADSSCVNMVHRVSHLVFNNFVYNHGHNSELYGMALSAINGFLHGLAWNSHFPTPTEALLWKLSCFGIVVCPVVTWLVSLRDRCTEAAVHAVWKLRFEGEAQRLNLGSIIRSFCTARNTAAWRIQNEAIGGNGQEPASGVGNKSPGWRWLLTVDATWYMACLYTWSILYFAVEAFISIRSLPAGSYDLPSWAQEVPHI